ncbi:Spermine/spermidine synthase [Ancylostoma ceylanicum]|uniref:Spermine/spermidine synthase n=1 Tax=Ancylostoma ceylanicum TaxID=53326 RepID=A0A0D6LAL7_9BILA|nr:Spermine/spermidine synthase [Ancylostoma ceylanicum]
MLSAVHRSFITPIVDVCDSEHYETISDRDAAGYFINKYGYRRTLEKSICLKDGSCVDIVDTVAYKGGRYFFVRDIAAGQILLSRMYLKLPQKSESSDVSIYDTSNWRINKTALDFFSYTTTMIEEMFTSGVVEMSKDTAAQMNITVVDIEPKTLEITKKWFDLDLDDRHRVVIMDGVEFIKRAAEEGTKYDVIHIDACKPDPSADLACPLKIFLTPATVENLSKVLTDKGAVILNVINLQGKIQESAELVKSSFGDAFKVCTVKMAPYSHPNMVMTCGRHDTRKKGLKEKYIKFAKYPKSAEYEEVFV